MQATFAAEYNRSGVPKYQENQRLRAELEPTAPKDQLGETTLWEEYASELKSREVQIKSRDHATERLAGQEVGAFRTRPLGEGRRAEAPRVAFQWRPRCSGQSQGRANRLLQGLQGQAVHQDGGERPEQDCEIACKRVRAGAFPRVYFEKDDDPGSGSEGDYPYSDYDDEDIEIVSIVAEMKNENDAIATKHA